MTAASGADPAWPLKIFIVVAEESGDQLGFRLMGSLRDIWGDDLVFKGTGGSRMESAGLEPLLRPGEVDIIGFSGLFSRLPQILKRIRDIAEVAVAFEPDVMILVDSPEFSHRVARIVREKRPNVPIINYVSPSVWAWRSRRGRKMLPYVDHVLALLPFEPAVYREIGGPPCTYVGHPLLEKVPMLRPNAGERKPIGEVERPVLLMLPGSRRAEVKNLMGEFGETLELLAHKHGPIDAILPAVSHLADDIRMRMESWPIKATIVEGEDAKYAAFRSAHVALAASGTVSLELALSGIPTVVTYQVDAVLRPFKWRLRVPSVVLANVVLRERVVPELLDGRSTPERLAAELLPLLRDSPARQRQIDAFTALDSIMAFDEGTPSRRAAEMIVKLTEDHRAKHAASKNLPKPAAA